MRHILFISHARGIHGAEAVMVQAAKACVSKGARVTIVVPSIVPDEGLEAALKDIQGVKTMALPYRAAGGGWLRTGIVGLYNMPTAWRLKRFIQAEQVDTIYSNTSITMLGAQLARLVHVRHVWHWHEPVDKQFGWHRSLRPLYGLWAKEADLIICISRHQLREWEHSLEMLLTNALIVYNPIKRIETQARSAHSDVCLGFIGHFEQRKNLELLVRAFERLHQAYPNTALRLCGAIDEKDRLYVEKMTDLRAPIVEILPQTSDVGSFYNSIDMLVLPSWRETMPLVILEAMQAGVCVLQTNQSGMKELIDDGKESLFFSPDDEETLFAQLMRCMDADYRHKIAQSGQQKALKLVNNQSFDEQITRLLCE